MLIECMGEDYETLKECIGAVVDGAIPAEEKDWVLLIAHIKDLYESGSLTMEERDALLEETGMYVA